LLFCALFSIRVLFSSFSDLLLGGKIKEALFIHHTPPTYKCTCSRIKGLNSL
jgi:hypothetical protein